MTATTQQAIQEAQAAGFTHGKTFGGPVSLRSWEPGDFHRLTFEGQYLGGPWRPLDAIERIMLKDKGEDPAQHLARDRFPLLRILELVEG